MNFTITVLLFVVVDVIASSSNSKNCLFKYPKDFPDQEPVFIWNHSLLILPERDVIELKAGAKIIVGCPGHTNFLIKSGEKFSVATCVSDVSLTVEDVDYEISDLACSTSVTGEFQATTMKCANFTGIIKHIGYYVNDDFLSLFDICYNNKNGESLYSNHTIIGSAIPYAKPEILPMGFDEGGLAIGVNPNNYKQKLQLNILTDLLGSADLANNYIFPGSYLKAVHLVPYADQIYVTFACSTYFYINTVPQWQQINNENWNILEYSIRSLALSSNENFQVITGGWQVLQLEDVNGNLVDIYLSGDKLPVPKFVWKVVYSSQTKEGIAFVCVNNPFIKEVTKDDYICTNICDMYNWGNTDWSTATKGLLYCCDVEELRKKIDTIPNFNVINVLEGFSASKVLKQLFDM